MLRFACIYAIEHVPSAPSGERSRLSLRSCRELRCFAPMALATLAVSMLAALAKCFASLAVLQPSLRSGSAALLASSQRRFAPLRQKKSQNVEFLNFRIFGTSPE